MLVLGVMSGTSLDGVDLALVKFSNPSHTINFTILSSETIPYPKLWYDQLLNAHNMDVQSLRKLSRDYGFFLAKLIQEFIEKTSIQPELIASHGHTILHEPNKGMTLQIGNGPEIHSILNIPVVCDFRVQDVLLGGQGAPLVPVGDRLLFSEFDSCVNLGGFINLSYEENKDRIAYDVCPMNIVMNDLSSKYNVTYDDKGLLAKSGTLDLNLFKTLNALDFYSQKPPKSLGKEWVLDEIWPILTQVDEKVALRTFVEHCAYQLADNIKGKAKVLLTGGGVYNEFFIERLSHYSNSDLIVPDKEIVEFKEAVIFALLGFLKWNGQVNVLSSVTGARRNHSSGKIYR